MIRLWCKWYGKLKHFNQVHALKYHNLSNEFTCSIADLWHIINYFAKMNGSWKRSHIFEKIGFQFIGFTMKSEYKKCLFQNMFPGLCQWLCFDSFMFPFETRTVRFSQWVIFRRIDSRTPFNSKRKKWGKEKRW